MGRLAFQSQIKVFATPGSEKLAQDICLSLQTRLPKQLIPYEGGKLRLGGMKLEIFSNGNPQVEVENVRDYFTVVVNTQVPPVMENFVILQLLLDALINADAGDILLVFPYMTFSRSDKKNRPRISTMGHRFARMIGNEFGIDRVLLMDPHDGHIKHYFSGKSGKAANEISAMFLLVDYLLKTLFKEEGSTDDWVVVFADTGASRNYRKVAHLLRLPTAYIDKDRPDDSEKPEVQRVVGDVKDKNCILIDDESLTGGTLISDSEYLFAAGAKRVIAAAIHAVLEKRLNGGACVSPMELIKKLEDSRIEKFIFTDSIPVYHKISSKMTKFTILSIAPFLAEAIARTILGDSLTELHRLDSVDLYRSY